MTRMMRAADTVSSRSRKAYNKATRIDAELRQIRADLEPLHRKMLTLQEASRLAYEEMYASFAEDGLPGDAAFRQCQEIESAKAMAKAAENPNPPLGANDPGELGQGHNN